MPSEPERDFAAVAAPKVDSRTLASRLASPESRWIVAAAAFQLGILAYMVYLVSRPFLGTTTVVRIQVEPVDPRDLLRGDHVILSYPFSRVPSGGIEGLNGPLRDDESASWVDTPVFTRLVPVDGDAVRYRGEALTTTRPPSGDLYLEGKIKTRWRIEFGIESFYVQEGTGKAYEDAVRERKLWTEVAVSPDGQGQVRGLHVE